MKKLKRVFERNKIYPFPWYFAEQCLTKDLHDIFGVKASKTILECQNTDNTIGYFESGEMAKIGNFLFEKIKNDEKFYKVVEERILKYSKEILDFSKKIKKINHKKLSDKDLIKLIEEYSKKIRVLRSWGWVPPLIDGMEIYFLSNYIQENFKQFLKGKKSEEEIARYYSILSSSEGKSEIQQEEISRLKLIKKIENIYPEFLKLFAKDFSFFEKKIKNKSDILNLIQGHIKKFDWLPYAYVGPKLGLKDIFNLVKNSFSKKESVEEQINNISDRYRGLKKQKQEIHKSIKLSAKLQYLFEVSSFFMHLKDFRKGIYQKSYVAMDHVMLEISKRLNLSMVEIKFLTVEEMKESLINKKDFKQILKHRLIYCVSVNQNGKTKIYEGKEAKKIIKDHTTSEKMSEDEILVIKGSVAYSGHAVGIAKIVLVPEDIKKVKKGDILISSATNPDLILAMKEAAAFVTDMGGITSHAAIVSREMQKPCIVGTRIATKIIKDGDLVEVDAVSGIVQIIKN